MGVALLSPFAFAPVRGSDGAAGIDLRATTTTTIAPGERAMIPTDLQIEFPEGCYGRIAERSGLALNYSISVGGGVIDPDYKGGICVILINNGERDFQVFRGYRIAQIICEKFVKPEIVIIEQPKDPDTERGCNGFGSTGE